MILSMSACVDSPQKWRRCWMQWVLLFTAVAVGVGAVDERETSFAHHRNEHSPSSETTEHVQENDGEHHHRHQGGHRQHPPGRSTMHCQPMPDVDTLEFTQETAAQSNNALIATYTNLINQRFHGVKNVDINLRGDSMHRRVGFFDGKAVITRITAEDTLVEECYTISYEIKDVNECILPPTHALRHNCHAGALCQNTNGSYECGCAEGWWGEKDTGSTDAPPTSMAFFHKMAPGACGGEMSTYRCCQDRKCDDPKNCATRCKANFRCTNDPCHGNECDKHATCVPGSGYQDYTCVCRKGYRMGDDGKCEADIPVEDDHCRDNSCPVNCRCVSDRQHKVYQCVAKPGYHEYSDPTAPAPYDAYPNGKRTDNLTACLSGFVPTISLNGESTVYYRQGETYQEQGVTVVDQNEMEDERTVKLQYSQPFGAFFAQTGHYHVDYSIETPWLHIENLHKRREVIVTDVDECKYDGPRDMFRHNCVHEAKCINTDGSYMCECAPGYAGDGLTTGDGCRDVTPPVMLCQGEGCGPVRFRACNCMGIVKADGSYSLVEDHLDEDLIQAYLEKMDTTLCSGKGGESDVCFVAHDLTVDGPQDLTARILRGPMERDPAANYTWRVPFDVEDDAGNRAETAYVVIEIETVDVLQAIRGGGAPLTWDSLSGTPKTLLIGLVALFAAASMGLFSLLLWLRAWCRGLQYLVAPYSLLHSKEDFDLGYDLVLRLRSFNALTAKERQRKIAARWVELLESLDS